MVHVENRVVVERRFGRHVAIEVEVVLAGVPPPGFEGLGVVGSAVSVVMEPQTEARSGQSKWPDLRVLSMAANRCGQPLLGEVLGNAGVRPRERVVAVADHVVIRDGFPS